ncbi:dachshund homolog 2 isoform X1 [Phascolarctos cinereus]|uniref:Dachshund homolog 2 isoform X1 n=1 Tax=Phascolarctos cinereus TaxID=38626 RepID=A0A6P5IN43_PHACI|nr:dachshund homolog 2 isoform X1 [Phascolarctos cinereus]
MAVSAPPVISATSSSSSSSAGAPGVLFRAEPLYSSSPSESPRLTTSMINSFISTSGSGSGMSAMGGGGMSAMGGGGGMSAMSGGMSVLGGGGGISGMSGGGLTMSGGVSGMSGGGLTMSGGGSGGNECKMVDLHGVKVASFLVEGQELICLPQVFDLFLKHLVGGLHTVYTKLKRLDITPVVCTVEQVRILRGLGAIQPGVNRCKLITRKDFETLYNDCTNASSRPGRPPKRSLGVAIQENARLLPHGVPGLISPGLISPTGITAAAMAEAMKLQKMKLMAMNSLHGGGSQNGTESENEELNSNAGGSESSWDKEKMQSPMTPGSQPNVGHATLPGQASLGSAHPLNPLQQNHLLTNRLDLPFMMMPHPLLPVTLPPASVAMAMNQMNHLNTIANMAAAAQMHSPLTRAEASVIKERIQESPSPAPSLDEGLRPVSLESSHHSSSMSSSPSQMDHIPERFALMSANREGEFADQDNGSNAKKHQKEKVLSFNQELFDDSQSLWGGKRSIRQGARPQDPYHQVWAPRQTEEVQVAMPIMKPGLEKVQLAGQAVPAGFSSPFIFADSLSSVETLLTNIQGLLKVALDNARVQEKQMQQEKKELRMELFRERELRETLERQLAVELQSRATIQKRLKKEKKAKRKLQEALEFESKRREQVEQALKQASTDTAMPDREIENGTQPDNAATMQESQVYIKPPVMY